MVAEVVVVSEISLVRCKRTNYIYQAFRDRHYVKNNGSVGQQLHYLIYLNNECVGIISGGSAVYSVKSRDDYFGITKGNRQIAINGIIDNTVFRLEKNIPNLATQILKKWRKRVAVDWEIRYGVRPCGFETFVIENERRKGSLYKADNWDFVGKTQGSTKLHQHGIDNKFQRIEVPQKLIFCKHIKGVHLPETYQSNWKDQRQVRGQISLFDYDKEDT